MNYLDLFSGIGGFHKGLEEAGFKFDWTGHSEIDKYAKQIYQKHFSESEDLGDVTNINVSELPEIDLITFGFPCQDLSIAGKRGGLEASRSGLFYKAVSIIEATKPSYFIFENVKGLFSSNNGKDFLSVLGAIADIGYDGQWQLLNTRWFLPQNRERIYFVGYPRGTGGRQIFPIGESGEFTDNKQGNNAESNIASCLQSPGNACGNYKGMNAVQAVLTPDRAEKRQNGRRFKEDGEPMFTLTSQDQHGVKIGTWRTHKDGQGFREVKSGDSPTIPARAREDGSGQPVVKITQRGRGFNKGGEKDVCPTISTSAFEHNNYVSGIRRLTPTECERLQGFPDGWTEGVSDTQRYKCLGNAVSVPVVKAVGERIINEKTHNRNKV